MGQYAINIVGVIGAWFLMSRGIGRRSLYLYGLCGLFVMLMVMGFLGLAPESQREAAGLATGSMMYVGLTCAIASYTSMLITFCRIVWAAVYQLTVGTVCYSLVSEMSTRRLQIKTVVLGRNLYIIVGIIASVLTPYMLNPSAWNWGNYAGFVSSS